ncbi:MAG: myo-inositol-1(or 4)-monophosphatase, partial [Parcubacteria group bacterium Gr01-1014_70]
MKQDYPDTSYLCNLATKCGNFIVANFNLGLGMTKERKSDATPLTVTDTTINAEVCACMRRDFPHIQVLGEEESSEIENTEYTVMCDPVDGTIPFSHGLPISTFCISVLHNQMPIVGVIYDPFLGRMWHAEHGGGSFLGTE